MVGLLWEVLAYHDVGRSIEAPDPLSIVLLCAAAALALCNSNRFLACILQPVLNRG